MNIENNIKEYYRGAEQTPPADMWERISQQLDAAGVTPEQPAPKPTKGLAPKSWGLLAAAVAVVGAAVGAVAWLRADGSADRAQAVEPQAQVLAVEFAQALAAEPVSSTPVAASATTLEAQPQRVPAPCPSVVQTSAAPRPTDVAKTVASQPSPVSQPAVAPVQTQAQSVVPPAASTAAPQTAAAQPKSAPQPDNFTTRSYIEAPVVTPAVDRNEAPAQPVKPQIRISTVLTPNGDGVNDYWYIDGLEDYPGLGVRIFTAQGRCVYQDKNYHNQYQGDGQPDGDYFYEITIPSLRYVTRGALHIKR